MSSRTHQPAERQSGALSVSSSTALPCSRGHGHAALRARTQEVGSAKAFLSSPMSSYTPLPSANTTATSAGMQLMAESINVGLPSGAAAAAPVLPRMPLSSSSSSSLPSASMAVVGPSSAALPPQQPVFALAGHAAVGHPNASLPVEAPFTLTAGANDATATATSSSPAPGAIADAATGTTAGAMTVHAPVPHGAAVAYAAQYAVAQAAAAQAAAAQLAAAQLAAVRARNVNVPGIGGNFGRPDLQLNKKAKAVLKSSHQQCFERLAFMKLDYVFKRLRV